jgi:hypothetical protein
VLVVEHDVLPRAAKILGGIAVARFEDGGERRRRFGVDWWRLCTGQTTAEKLGLVMAD